MRFVLLGGPGSGKGTQAGYTTARFGIPQISTGDMLRAAVADGSALGRAAKSYMISGALVPDEIIIELVGDRIKRRDTTNGFLLDGFPRTIKQAQAMRQGCIDIDLIIEIAVDEAVMIKRTSGRWIHLASGRTYHIEFNPPSFPGKDDVSGEDLVQRLDDREETVRKRISAYLEQTLPMVDYYREWIGSGDSRAPRYVRIDGHGAVQTVCERLSMAIEDALQKSKLSLGG